eukprot:g1042.t1
MAAPAYYLLELTRMSGDSWFIPMGEDATAADARKVISLESEKPGFGLLSGVHAPFPASLVGLLDAETSDELDDTTLVSAVGYRARVVFWGQDEWIDRLNKSKRYDKQERLCGALYFLDGAEFRSVMLTGRSELSPDEEDPQPESDPEPFFRRLLFSLDYSAVSAAMLPPCWCLTTALRYATPRLTAEDFSMCATRAVKLRLEFLAGQLLAYEDFEAEKIAAIGTKDEDLRYSESLRDLYGRDLCSYYIHIAVSLTSGISHMVAAHPELKDRRGEIEQSWWAELAAALEIFPESPRLWIKTIDEHNEAQNLLRKINGRKWERVPGAGENAWQLVEDHDVKFTALREDLKEEETRSGRGLERRIVEHVAFYLKPDGRYKTDLHDMLGRNLFGLGLTEEVGLGLAKN